MDPLEAAKALVEVDPYFDWADGAPDDQMVCIACSRYRQYGHADDCPILRLPAIVAALEAAERLAKSAHYWGECEMYHVESDEVRALVAALKGEAAKV